MAWKYQKQVTIGYDQDGKRVRKRIYSNSKQDLQYQERLLLQNTEYELLSSALFGDYAEHWFSTYKGNKETRTKDYYRTGLKKLESLYGRELKDIKRSDVQQIISDNWDHPRTCGKLAGIMQQIFRSAMEDGLINRMPTVRLTLPKPPKVEKRILTDAERAAAKNADLPEKERLFLDVIMYLGLRPEEARALTPFSIDFTDKSISITQAVIFNDNSPELKDTKTGKHRTLPLPEELLPELRKAVRGAKGYLFTDTHGNLMSKSSYRCMQDRIFRAINRELGGDDYIDNLNGMTFYTFRHTRGTQLYYLTQSGGISTKMAAEYMGHSEMVFLSTYSHIDPKKEHLEILRNVE